MLCQSKSPAENFFSAGLPLLYAGLGPACFHYFFLASRAFFSSAFLVASYMTGVPIMMEA